MKKQTKQLVTAVAACTLIGAMAVGGTMAYLTDHAEATNTFTVGEVKVDLTEPNYPGNDEPEVENLVPNQEVPKDPQITNNGMNDALVFMAVEVPVGDVTVVEDDGTKGIKGITDLFWFKLADDAKGGTIKNNFNTSDWLELDAHSQPSEAVGTDSVYVFAYKTALSRDETGGTDSPATTPLFDKIQLKNVIENEVTAGEDIHVNVKAYAIQAAEILEENADLTEELSKENLTKIYEIYINQNSELEP